MQSLNKLTPVRAGAAALALTIVNPKVIHLCGSGFGDRLDEPLKRLKDWMERQHATLVAVILFVIGVLVLYKGIHGL